MIVACLDLEGVLVPEIWINVAEKTGIKELRRTTRDEPDYDKLMKGRLAILDQHKLTLQDIQDVIATLKPLKGAGDFLDWLRSEFQVIILSDTFAEFAKPLMKQLGWPTLFCHSLETDNSKRIVNYRLRIPDQKKKSVEALRSVNLKTIAAGDSYNDVSMLQAAHAGILFCPPDNVIQDYPQFPVARTYNELTRLFQESSERIRLSRSSRT